MGRASIVIEKAELEREISLAEAAQVFENQSRLFEYICGTEWAKGIKDSLGRPKVPSPVNIYQRVKEYGIVLKTQAGKKGGGLKGPRVKGERFKGDKSSLLKYVPAEFKSLAEKASSGSMKAGIKLKCLDCCCWQPAEVRRCTMVNCPLYGFLKRDGKPEKNVEENA